MCKYTQKPRAMQIHLHCHVSSGGTGGGLMAARGGGLERTGVLSDRKKHGYPSQNALRNTLACFLAGEGTPHIKIKLSFSAKSTQK